MMPGFTRRALRLSLVASIGLGATAVASAREATPHPHATQAALFEPTPGSRHDFADVEHWRRVFDDPARDVWQKPRELVAALALRPGAWVADLGAGTGYFSRWLAAAVGPTGAVFAIDTEPNLVAHLRRRAEEERTPTVIPVLASADDPRLPPAALDLVLIVDTYHHLDARLAYLRRLAAALKPAGRVAIVDWEKRPLPVGPPPEHKLARAQVIEEMGAAGFALVDEPGLLPHQYFLVFARGAQPIREGQH
ncbi:MAG: class I SAM-dependent methyltransferase [Deltaproteobacteria bacterium]|nr:class I SAM-dependent methyltransferase [Deltaproteobacteria bacterium]